MPETDLKERIDKTHAYTAVQQQSAAIASAKKAHAIVDEIAAFIRPGMLESEVKNYALACFARHNITRTWHQPYIRFGEHTLLTFTDKPEADFCIGENDIAYIDIGIVENGIEGDAGRSIVFGADKELNHLVTASEAIFHDAVAYWQRHNPTGIALYDHIYTLAEKMGVAWNLDPAGHLIGAFPHKGWKTGINHFPEPVESGKWILEIQIRHKELPYGAFYEDLLYTP